MRSERKIWLGNYERLADRIKFAYGLDEHRFTLVYEYEGVDLFFLEERFGPNFMENVYFHVVAFEAIKLISFRPSLIDLGPFARYHTSTFESLWRAVCHNVWGQWRYENNLPDYEGPQFSSQPHLQTLSPREIPAGPVESLLFFGGGKDSLVAMKLLEESKIPFSTYTYASSAYGETGFQHELIERLGHHIGASTHHRTTIQDDFWLSDTVALCERYGTQCLLSAETPASIFGTLPHILSGGYRSMVLAHERSADFSNLIWTRTGEEINHQWGKSHRAERLFEGYLREALVSNLRYFSILKPMYDTLIFATLNRYLDAIPATHSCNQVKPWCGRCAKCAYVWLGYLGYLPREVVTNIFRADLIELPENELFFRQLLGLEDHTPFECVGTVDESRLAFYLCLRKGLRGLCVDSLSRSIARVDLGGSLERLLTTDLEPSSIPHSIKGSVARWLREASAEAKKNILRFTSS